MIFCRLFPISVSGDFSFEEIMGIQWHGMKMRKLTQTQHIVIFPHDIAAKEIWQRLMRMTVGVVPRPEEKWVQVSNVTLVWSVQSMTMGQPISSSCYSLHMSPFSHSYAPIGLDDILISGINLIFLVIYHFLMHKKMSILYKGTQARIFPNCWLNTKQLESSFAISFLSMRKPLCENSLFSQKYYGFFSSLELSIFSYLFLQISYISFP